MSQYLTQSFGQHLRMEQRLTPQLIQSMTVLQKPVADLEAYIEDMLESNAALEVAEPEQLEEDRDGTVEHDRRDDRGVPERDRIDRLRALGNDFDPDYTDRRPLKRNQYSDRGEPDAKLGAMANTAGREQSLPEYLLDQWSLLEVDPEVRRAGLAVIGHVDPDGYLRVRLNQIAESTRPPLSIESCDAALLLIQKLEPVGIGARNLIECLLLQLALLPGDNRLERTLIERHLSDIAHNRLPAVAKATGYELGEINEAIRAIRESLIPDPGFLVGGRTLPPIRPDVIVDYADTGGGLTVALARGNMPKLRIRDEVAEMAKSRGNGAEVREFARRHVDEATSLIDAVRFRHGRLLEVAKAIIEKQREFFDGGPDRLRVLRMSDLAEEIGCDPSTISRTVADKHMQTPRGIYPLRYFFTGGTETPDGESLGWDRVKLRVRELIGNEDRKKPFSDDQISGILKSEGIELSRRTVAKYRQQLDIPAMRQRRVY